MTIFFGRYCIDTQQTWSEMDVGPSFADDDRNHSTPAILMLGVNRPQMAGKCLILERKDFTSLGDGSAQVISSYLPAHACEVLVLVLMLVLVLALVLSGRAARVRYMIRQHRMQKVQVRGGTRPLPSIASSGRLKSGPPLPSLLTHAAQGSVPLLYGKNGMLL